MLTLMDLVYVGLGTGLGFVLGVNWMDWHQDKMFGKDWQYRILKILREENRRW